MTPKELKDWRERNSYSQVELAKELGVTNVCLSRWEIGMREIPSFLALALRALELEGGKSVRKRNGKRKKVKK